MTRHVSPTSRSASSFLFTTPFGLQNYTQDLETFHSLPIEISKDLPGPCQSFCASNLLSFRRSFRRSFNYKQTPHSLLTSPFQLPTLDHQSVAMFKRSYSHRQGDRIEKVSSKLKKSSRDPAKLSKLQRSFERAEAVQR